MMIEKKLDGYVYIFIPSLENLTSRFYEIPAEICFDYDFFGRYTLKGYNKDDLFSKLAGMNGHRINLPPTEMEITHYDNFYILWLARKDKKYAKLCIKQYFYAKIQMAQEKLRKEFIKYQRYSLLISKFVESKDEGELDGRQ